MTVGKATAVTPQEGPSEFRFVAPCFTGIDEARIREALEHRTVEARRQVMQAER